MSTILSCWCLKAGSSSQSSKIHGAPSFSKQKRYPDPLREPGLVFPEYRKDHQVEPAGPVFNIICYLYVLPISFWLILSRGSLRDTVENQRLVDPRPIHNINLIASPYKYLYGQRTVFCGFRFFGHSEPAIRCKLYTVYIFYCQKLARSLFLQWFYIFYMNLRVESSLTDL